MLIDNDEVAAVVQQAPDRFKGVASVDLRDPVRAVREIRRCVGELGFVGVRIVPWVWELPPDDRRYYPVYLACVEVSVPFRTQIGHTGPLFPSEPGRPIPYFDRVLLDFPDLVVVGGHVGFPWIDEVLSLASSVACPHRVHAGPRQRTRSVRDQLADGLSRSLPRRPGRSWPRRPYPPALSRHERDPYLRLLSYLHGEVSVRSMSGALIGSLSSRNAFPEGYLEWENDWRAQREPHSHDPGLESRSRFFKEV
jgi:Amidohydrolase